jgi:hypothetical protein
LDGRDTPPTSGLDYIKQLEGKMGEIGAGKLATVSGRYYAMDRDNRWERVCQAYEALVYGKGGQASIKPKRPKISSQAPRFTSKCPKIGSKWKETGPKYPVLPRNAHFTPFSALKPGLLSLITKTIKPGICYMAI